MQKANPKLDRLISELTTGDATPIPPGEEMGGERVGSGEIAEIDEATFRFYREDNAGAPKMAQDHWFIFSDNRNVAEPGILFWQNDDSFFARRLEADDWERLITAAKVKKAFW